MNKTNSAPATDPNKLLQLQVLADQIRVHAEAALGCAARLQAFHALVVNYTRLLFELEDRLADLKSAVQAGQHRLPSVDQLEQIVSNARLAYALYLQTK